MTKVGENILTEKRQYWGESIHQKFTKISPELVRIKQLHQKHKFCRKWRWAPICDCNCIQWSLLSSPIDDNVDYEHDYDTVQGVKRKLEFKRKYFLNAPNHITRYNVNGFVEELPRLPENRFDHACASLPATGVRPAQPNFY